MELDLTPSEMRLIRAYRRCSDSCQSMMVEAAELYAEAPLLKRPEPPKPALRLVTSGASYAEVTT
jgi:hypothetical protein